MNKMIKKSLISLLIGLCSTFSQTMEIQTSPYEEFSKTISREKLLEEHSVDSELKVILDANLTELINKPQTFSWLPGFIIKKEQGRVHGSLFIRDTAKKLGCNLVTAPVARYYKSKLGQDCSIERIINISQEPFSLEQTKQLYTIMQATNLADITAENVLNTPEGIATIVDVEKLSFARNGQYTELQYLSFIKIRDSFCKDGSAFTPEARQWRWEQETIIKYKEKVLGQKISTE